MVFLECLEGVLGVSEGGCLESVCRLSWKCLVTGRYLEDV